MVVQHNLTAMNSNRMLGLTTKTQAKSTEKLSSGYKINRAEMMCRTCNFRENASSGKRSDSGFC